MFRDSDIEWLRVIGCMKKAGMSIKDIRQYIELALKGDDTIELRLKMFQHQKEVLRQKLEEMQHTMDRWTTSAGTMKLHDQQEPWKSRRTWTKRMSRSASAKSGAS